MSDSTTTETPKKGGKFISTPWLFIAGFLGFLFFLRNTQLNYENKQLHKKVDHLNAALDSCKHQSTRQILPN